MNKSEAYDLLAKKLAELLRRTQSAPLAEVALVECSEVRGDSGTIYQVGVRCYWECKEKGKIKVVGSIADDGKLLVQALHWSVPVAAQFFFCKMFEHLN